jgi:hypothetical protein
MQHTIIFNSTLTAQTVQDLMNECTQYPFVNLYFSTDGGNIFETNILVDYLNYRYREGSLKLTLYDFVASAGALLLMDYVGPIFLMRNFRGFMFHAPDINVGVMRPGVFGKKSKELLDVLNEELFKKYKDLGLTKSDVEKIKNGEDVYVWFNEISKIKRDFFEYEETVVNLKLAN